MSESPATASRWSRTARQDRSRVTQELILDAAEELFSEQGIDDTSMHDVAERAERSIGSLYHHFDTKDVLVHAVVDRILADSEAEIDTFFAPGRWDGRPALHVVRAYLRGTLGLDQGRPGYKRIIHKASTTDAETLTRSIANRQRVNDGLREVLTACRAEIGHPDPATAIGLAIDTLTALVAARVDRGSPTESAGLSNTGYVELVLDAVGAILQLEQEIT